ncbi:MAG: SMP-30/gluconolactonase/LRE family protein [Fischerella sp.]|nr:SMP-30/gluconolactonase/LRE family protein [Fischerella sp.]
MMKDLDGMVESELLATGFRFTEGPVWNARGGFLLFSDIPSDVIYRWTEEEGVEIFRRPSGKSNGLTLDKRGKLIACEHATRRVTRTELDGTLTVLASKFKGRKLNSPNDVVVRSDGSIYFTDPPYGLNPIYGVFESQELPFCGLFRISPDEQHISLLCDEIVPNGLAFSPDESLLYVADTENNHLYVFDVKSTGELANGRLFSEIKGDPLAPDGVKVDEDGNIYVTGKGGIWVLNESGKRIRLIEIPELPANLAWGGEDWKTLFVTARTSLYRIRLEVKGIPVGA